MKKYIKTIITLCVVALAFSACEKEEIATFNGKDVIYFQWAIDGKEFASQKIDSTAISFALELPTEVTDSLVLVPVKIQGYVSSKDRTVTVEVMEESTAQKDIHYTIPDEITVSANEYIGYIPVTLIRTEDMKVQEVSLKLQLLENENFKVDLWGEELSDNNPNRILSYKEFEITISDMLTEPDRWSVLEKYLGAFSVKKYYLIAEVNEMPLPNYNVLTASFWPDFYGHVAVLKAYLEAQENAGTPILEEDGTEMVLGPNA